MAGTPNPAGADADPPPGSAGRRRHQPKVNFVDLAASRLLFEQADYRDAEGRNAAQAAPGSYRRRGTLATTQ